MIQCIFEHGHKTSLRHIVVDILVLKDDKILLVKRADRLIEGGKWAMIGGYMERNENLKQAVEREIFEETGYKVKDITLLTINDNPDRPNEDKQNISFVYFCTGLEKEGNADDESTKQQWFPFNKLPSVEEIAFDHYQNIQIYLYYKKANSPLPVVNYSQSRYLK